MKEQLYQTSINCSWGEPYGHDRSSRLVATLEKPGVHDLKASRPKYRPPLISPNLLFTGNICTYITSRPLPNSFFYIFLIYIIIQKEHRCKDSSHDDSILLSERRGPLGAQREIWMRDWTTVLYIHTKIGVRAASL